MFQFFLIIFLINMIVNLSIKNIKQFFLTIKLLIIFILFYFLLTSYIGGKFFLIINFHYLFNQLTNYLFINLFNVNWTNLYLLALFLISYISFYLNNNLYSINFETLKTKIYKFLFIIVLCGFFKNFSEIYLYPIEKLCFFTIFISDVNSLLLNNLVLIHPIFTHILYSYFIFYAFYHYVVNNIMIRNNNINAANKNYAVNTMYLYFYKKVILFLVISYLTIYLGSTWAAQELVWNSWWNWDIIEIIAFGFFILLTFYVHYLKKINCYWQFINFSFECLLIFILFYFFIRLDISASLHSFNLFDSVEIYLYFFYLCFLFLFYFIMHNKIIIKIKFYKLILSYKHKNKNFFYIIIFFKLFLISLYFYCFLVWFNDSEGYVLKNEIVWIYSLLYKYILLFLFSIYYFFIFKVNWLTLIFLVTNFVLILYMYKFFKNTSMFLKNLYILLHLLILLFLFLGVLDNSVQILSYSVIKNIFGINKLIYLSKKITLFHWNSIDIFFDFNFFYNKILFFKHQYNSFLLFKVHYIELSNFELISWTEQSYNYYLNTNFLKVLLKNLYFKENNVNVILNKIAHYIIQGVLFFFFLLIIFFKKKKIKILNFI